MNLRQIDTEKRNVHTLDIDTLSSLEIIRQMNKEDQSVPKAVERVLPVIAEVIDRVVAAFGSGGRLIYVGAGTSGRLGVLDASECPPTYGVPKEQVIGVIAGGEKALQSALEGAEDNIEQAIEDMKQIHVNQKDVVIGIAASGRTPYTLAAMKYAKSVGATVAAITCTKNSEMEKIADYPIVVLTGPEVVAGSTRLKAGTAQKLVLNMITTAAMVRSGKVYSNLMVDVVPTNEKLLMRAKNMIIEIADVSEEEAEQALKTYQSAKAAILALMTGLTGEEVFHVLRRHNGHLRSAIQSQLK
ncbi:N-acetylmuramic acid 6-phosphate etherase [Anoxybacillus sp. B7M1]|jgi:N-acetylmuramic acid 6-phosphate etherase|uniref:N-acetylmuramic acid 6-phosphate etherase n=1 Tax=unclassified Anoxybacillus TaxID=2639704 RepID=UPI0005CDAFE4|nr:MULTISPECIES: N-acetylmuramic acid 6-phosphate etherase [unclassified Anoxybacillus]ANB56408.1 N-acetylmuramic acid 6-phosphate etherase [Anoxybacillus sp. B2M1]ANB64995.1 N-acetylmuramic acid 6-phosphate etherase [Anoxybacillus sp. B7M1]